MKQLILVGACYLDTILRKVIRSSLPNLVHASPNLPCSVPHFPEEDSKLRATNLSIRRGGNCPNSLEVLQQLVTDDDNVQLHLVSCLPGQDTPATKRIMTSFGHDSSISFRHCIYREGHTEAASSYIIRSRESDSRTIVNYNGLPEMTCDEFAAIIERFDEEQQTWWHFEGRIPDITLTCIHLLRQKLPKAKISVEVEKPGREGLCQLAAEADVVFYSRTWAESRGHKSAEACLTHECRRQGEQVPVFTVPWGLRPTEYQSLSEFQLTKAYRTILGKSPSCPVGAGDTFIAGMLLGLISNDWPLSDIGGTTSFAVKLATLKVQREGFEGLGVDMGGTHSHR